jgi:hypothetical protein
MTGTIASSDPRLTRAYLSQDSRNFAVQDSASELQADNIGLPGSFADPNQRFWVVVSHGDFNPNTDANVRSAPPVATSTPPQHANVAYVIIDARSGQYKGEEFKYPGCTKE